MARKSSLTPALERAIVTAIVGGVPYYQACALVGIPTSTASEWLERGEGRHPQRPTTPTLAAFAEAIARAKAQDEARRLLRINQAGQGGQVLAEKTTTYADGRVVVERQYAPPDWRSDAWHLEHAYPARYGRRLQADLTLQIQQAAQEVADEIGIDVSLVLREAQAYLREGTRGRPQ
jgi:hypothetical protein